MIIMEIAPEDSPQMRFPENDNVVAAIATYGTDQSFTVRILPRAPGRCHDFLDANRLNPFFTFFSINPVTIPQQIPRFAAAGKRLHELLTGPACGRVVCHIEMHDAPTIMGKNNEDKQDAKGGGGNHILEIKTTKAVLQSWFRSLPAGDAKVNGFSADRILAKDRR